MFHVVKWVAVGANRVQPTLKTLHGHKQISQIYNNMEITNKSAEESSNIITSWIDRLKKVHERNEREWRVYFLRNKMWVEDIESIGYFMDNSHESVIYKGYSEKEVFKIRQCGINRLYIDSSSFIDTLLSALWHNRLFPSTYYTLVGFTSWGNGVRAVLKQDYIKGEKPTIEQITNFLEQHGFKNLEINNGVSATKDSYFVSDIHQRNAIFANGTLYVIDCNIIENN